MLGSAARYSLATRDRALGRTSNRRVASHRHRALPQLIGGIKSLSVPVDDGFRRSLFARDGDRIPRDQCVNQGLVVTKANAATPQANGHVSMFRIIILL